jgi:hypothetical protein
MEGTKGQVNTEKRRVYLFIAVGLLAAAAVGYGVWRASTPSIPSASDTATATAEVSTNSDTAGQIVATPVPEEAGTSTESAPRAQVTDTADDPYLAPNAVVQAAPTDIGPTVVYRPENIMDTPAAGEPTAAQASPTPTRTGVGGVPGQPEELEETPSTPSEPGRPEPTTTPPTPGAGTPTPASPTTTSPLATPPAATPPDTTASAPLDAPATAQTQAPATTTPQPAPAGSSRPN